MINTVGQGVENEGIIFVILFLVKVIKSVFPGVMTFGLNFGWNDESNFMNVLGKSILGKDPENRKW